MLKCFKRYAWVLLLMMVSACGSRNLEDFQEEGEGVIRSLLQELSGIHNREQLQASSGALQKHFDRLVNLMISAEEWIDSHPEEETTMRWQTNPELSDLLRMELNRIYHLDRGRQMIEKAQENALHRLDAFERKRAKKMP